MIFRDNGVLFFGDRPLSEISFNLLEILSVGKCFPHIISWKTKLDLLCDLKPVMTDKDKYRIEIKILFCPKVILIDLILGQSFEDSSFIGHMSHTHRMTRVTENRFKVIYPNYLT